MAGKGQLNSWSVISKHVFENFKALENISTNKYYNNSIIFCS